MSQLFQTAIDRKSEPPCSKEGQTKQGASCSKLRKIRGNELLQAALDQWGSQLLQAAEDQRERAAPSCAWPVREPAASSCGSSETVPVAPSYGRPVRATLAVFKLPVKMLKHKLRKTTEIMNFSKRQSEKKKSKEKAGGSRHPTDFVRYPCTCACQAVFIDGTVYGLCGLCWEWSCCCLWYFFFVLCWLLFWELSWWSLSDHAADFPLYCTCDLSAIVLLMLIVSYSGISLPLTLSVLATLLEIAMVNMFQC